MKKRFSLFLALLIAVFLGCKKDSISNQETQIQDTTDYRDKITGTYKGKEIYKQYDFQKDSFIYDTTDLTLIISKIDQDSVINLKSLPEKYNYDFKYRADGSFFPNKYYAYPPYIALNDTVLSLYYKQGKSPNSYSAITYKQKDSVSYKKRRL
jgi:hypothetical protein